MPDPLAHPERRAAVVTGASSGIGRAAAEALAAAGHPVAFGARRLDVCEEAAAAARDRGSEAVALPLDLAEPTSVTQFAKAAREALGPIEVVVSNAAANLPGAVLDTDAETFERVLDVNLNGTHRLVHALLPDMVGRRRGDVVFVTSDVAERPRPHMAAYVTSKWGLEGYVRALQMELEGTGVRATIVRPGPTMTAMGFDWDPAVTKVVLDEWASWGFNRHFSFMPPEGVAEAILAAVRLPRGVHATVFEVQPEAPLAAESEQESP